MENRYFSCREVFAMFNGDLYVRLIGDLVYYALPFLFLLHVSHAEERARSHKTFRWGVRIHYGEKTFDVPGITESTEPQSVGVGRDKAGFPVVVSAVGTPLFRKESKPKDRDYHATDCVIFVNTSDGSHEVTRYHQPRPDRIIISPDGKYAAFASTAGWMVDERSFSVDNFSRKKIGKTNVSTSEIASRLRSAAVGTLRYSIWEVSPARPIWEMRFQDPKNEEISCQFQRPWEESARLVLPWWAIDSDPISRECCQIAFSSDSKYFISRDSGQCVHVLRISDGKQLDIDTRRLGAAPVAFALVGTENRIQIICEDFQTHEYNLITGEKHTDSKFELPKQAVITPGKTGLRTSSNFVLDSRTGMIALCKDGFLDIMALGNQTSFGTRRIIGFDALSRGLCRIDVSSDRKTLGLCYGYETYGSVGPDSDFVRKYEVVDLAKGHIIRRLCYSISGIELEGQGADAEASGLDVKNLTILPQGICACLTLEGSEAAYVVPLMQ